jgi:hypothetical protein
VCWVLGTEDSYISCPIEVHIISVSADECEVGDGSQGVGEVGETGEAEGTVDEHRPVCGELREPESLRGGRV